MESAGSMLSLFAGVALIAPPLWIGVVHLVARIGGWRRAATVFATDREVDGDPFPGSSAMLNGMARYRNTLTVVVSDDGVYIRPIMLFRLSHEPLFIPFSAVTAIEDMEFRLKIATMVRFSLGDDAKPMRLVLFGAGVRVSLRRRAPAALTEGIVGDRKSGFFV